ncbi:MAG TPA: hypothetical protein VN616_16425 [Puia sp.]|nr:hypothetical protein [Puia sp.]
MRKSAILCLGILICVSCARRKSLKAQLSVTFANHLGRFDSSARLDSIRVLWTIPVTDKLGRIRDDTIYMREYARLKTQLAGAQQRGEKDSILFLRYEIAVMEKEIDSISRGVGQGDTTHSFGTLMGCAYYVTGFGRSRADSTMLFADTSGTLRFTEFLDSSLVRTLRRMK